MTLGLNDNSVLVKTNRTMLCLAGTKQNLKLLQRIIEDMNGELHELTTGESFALPLIEHHYSIVFATSDVPIHLLTSLRDEPNLAGAKFVLLINGASEHAIAATLQKSFHFDLLIQRPLNSSLLTTELLQLLHTEQASAEVTHAEEAELNFTDDLKRNYISVVRQRVQALQAAVDLLRHSPNNEKEAENDRIEAQRLAHNMRGTSSSFGLISLSAAAAQLEAALTGSKPDIEELNGLIVRIGSEVELLEQRYGADCKGVKNVFAAINIVALMNLQPDEATKTLFDEASLNLVTANNVDDFFRLTESMPTDAVLIDLDLQSINGVEVARALREHEKLVEVPIGFIKEANSKRFIETDCAHAGGSLTLQQPLQVQDIINGCIYLVGINENGRPRILVVDDDPDFTALISATLAAEGMIVKSTTEPLKAESLLQEFSADLLILDGRMPQLTGIDLCHHLRANPRWRDLPILFLTAEKGIDTRIKAYESGADDYLLKPLIVPELLSRVKGRLERAKLLKERIGKDALTGLLLRRSFLERLESALQTASRQQDKVTICLLDIDHFKSINDSYGHGVGDDVLSALGRTISRRFRSADIRGRWGGEEFILAFPHTVAATAKGVVNRLLEEFRQLEFSADGKILTGVTFSAGIATHPDDAIDHKQLILCADDLLYRAKKAGRNRVCSPGD